MDWIVLDRDLTFVSPSNALTIAAIAGISSYHFLFPFVLPCGTIVVILGLVPGPVICGFINDMTALR
jgi:hypothetical protein